LSAIVNGLTKLVTALPNLFRTRKRKQILRPMLEDPRFKFRKLETLARATGMSEDDARHLLIDMGARASTARGAEAWGLRSRVD
jgi:hypothetical protein